MTGALTAAQLSKLLDLSAELQSLERLADLPGVLLPALLRLVDADVSGWNDIDAASGAFTGHLYPDDSSANAFAELSQLAEDPPLLRHFQLHPLDGPTRISDVCSNSEWQSSAAYTDVYRRYGIKSQIGFPVATNGARIGAVVLNRSTSDFTDTDRAVLAAVRPHIEIAHRRLLHDEARTAAKAALGPHAGWLLVDDTNTVIAFDTTAAELLSRCGATVDPGRPMEPPPIGLTLCQVDHDPGLGQRIYAVRLTDTPRSLGLTPRQYEALCAVADGSTVYAAARAIGVTPHTLATHLRDAYRALHVAGRLAAVNKLRTCDLLPTGSTCSPLATIPRDSADPLGPST